MRNLFFAATVAVGFLVIASSANADVVNSSQSGSTSLSMDPINSFTAGPVTMAPGITWSSTDSYSVYGYTGGYGFANNGSWSGLDMMGLNTNSGSMTISFDNAVSEVGGFLNYAPDYYGQASISVYDASHSLIESTNLNFRTNGGTNQGEFFGFTEAVADISYFYFCSVIYHSF